MRQKKYGTVDKKIIKRFEKLCDYVSDPENQQSVNHWERYDGFVFADYVLSNEQKVKAVLAGFGEAEKFSFFHETKKFPRKGIRITTPTKQPAPGIYDNYGLTLLLDYFTLRGQKLDDCIEVKEIRKQLSKFEEIIYLKSYNPAKK